ncbi:Uncharacterized protein ChrSV_3427 [Chromobacterium vaccinii]|nr:Uncharacterized protein ChrSW_3427 [Chromobacterium vaccinii]QND90884.1 Uncharacterized protein ChrSV_3427 [Chromobacterium vaccinii]
MLKSAKSTGQRQAAGIIVSSLGLRTAIDAFNKINAFIFMSLLFNHIPGYAQARKK